MQPSLGAIQPSPLPIKCGRSTPWPAGRCRRGAADPEEADGEARAARCVLEYSWRACWPPAGRRQPSPSGRPRQDLPNVREYNALRAAIHNAKVRCRGAALQCSIAVPAGTGSCAGRLGRPCPVGAPTGLCLPAVLPACRLPLHLSVQAVAFLTQQCMGLGLGYTSGTGGGRTQARHLPVGQCFLLLSGKTGIHAPVAARQALPGRAQLPLATFPPPPQASSSDGCPGALGPGSHPGQPLPTTAAMASASARWQVML